LKDPGRHLIIKVWHRPTPPPEAGSDVTTQLEDHVVGFGAVDVTPLLKGFPSVCGWYNVIDFTGRVRGQVRIEVKPERSDFNLNCLKKHQSSHVQRTEKDKSESLREDTEAESVTHHNDLDVTSPSHSDHQGEKGEESEVRWVLPEADVESQDLPDTMSGLAIKMSDLDRLSDRLRQKLDVFEGAAPSLSEHEAFYSALAPENLSQPADEGQTLVQIQERLANQLNALKSQLLDQASRLPTYNSAADRQGETGLTDLGSDLNWEPDLPGEDDENPHRPPRKDPDGADPSLSSN